MSISGPSNDRHVDVAATIPVMDDTNEFYVPPEDRVRRITFGTKPGQPVPWGPIEGYDLPVVGGDLWVRGLPNVRPIVLTLIELIETDDGGFRITGEVGERDFALLMEQFDDWSDRGR